MGARRAGAYVFVTVHHVVSFRYAEMEHDGTMWGQARWGGITILIA